MLCVDGDSLLRSVRFLGQDKQIISSIRVILLSNAVKSPAFQVFFQFVDVGVVGGFVQFKDFALYGIDIIEDSSSQAAGFSQAVIDVGECVASANQAFLAFFYLFFQ